MLGLSGVVLSLALVMRLCPKIPFSRLLNEQLIEKPLAWLATRQRVDLIYFTIVLIMLVAAGEMVVMLGSAELFFAHALDVTPYLHALAVSSVLVAVSRGNVALRTRQAKLSFWHVRELDVSASTFGKGAVRKRARANLIHNDDDPDPVLTIAA
uniref:hypothetical protein n=1 Tax=Altererythrobacter segetis TaxID=1104773 RepID=UPI00140A2099|nr:hypothetical protein [Altererythrobacter segetis]